MEAGIMRKAVCLGFVLGIMVFLGAVTVKAQDPLTVGPDIYKLLFENERVRAMEVKFNPGDSIGAHSHPDHFVYVIDPGMIRISHPDGSFMDVEGKAGDVFWMNAETHSAVNTGTTTMRLLVVELKEPSGRVDALAVTQ